MRVKVSVYKKVQDKDKKYKIRISENVEIRYDMFTVNACDFERKWETKERKIC